MTGQLVLPLNGLVAGTDQLVLDDGKVGIGTGNPGTYQLRVLSSENGIYSYISSGDGKAVIGVNTNTGGVGVKGTGNEYGVHGFNSSSGNEGRLGTSLYGVYGESSSGTGVHGYSTSSYGVEGHSDSSYGVHGYNSSSGNYGQLGTSNEGVYGYNSGGGNSGQLGTISFGVSGYGNTGVYGYGTSSIGVRAFGPSGGYDFYAAGPGTNYGPFTGAHEVKLANGFVTDIIPGLIVSVSGEVQVRTEEGEISYSSTLPTIQLSDTPNDKKVFGVLIAESPLPEDHWYQAAEGERFGIVNALGEGQVWVTNINGDIEAGDYITTSAIAGYGQKQDDDLLHSYTLGKATETIDWSQVTDTIEFNGQVYKIYPIAVVYTSG
jgi:hypothetical protein